MAESRDVRRVVVVSGPLPVRPFVRLSIRDVMERVQQQRVRQSAPRVHMRQGDRLLVPHVQVARSIVRRKQAAVRR